MTTIGETESFDETQEKWETCVKRMEQFFLGNIIDDNHQVPTLSSISGKTYTLLRDLLTPELPGDHHNPSTTLKSIRNSGMLLFHVRQQPNNSSTSTSAEPHCYM